MKTALLRVLPCLVLVAVLAGCGTFGGSSVPLRVGVSPDEPPVAFKQAGAVCGFEADLAYRLANQLHRPLVFVELDWSDLIPSLLNGDIDIIMSGMTITPEREVRISFSKPYLRVGQMALVRRPEVGWFENLSQRLERSDINIGVQRGTTGERFVETHYPRARKVVYSTPADAALGLKTRRIDVLVHDAPAIWWLASQYEADLAGVFTPLTEEYLGWGMRRDDVDFREDVDGIIDRWKKDGTLQDAALRWIPGVK